MLLRSSFSRVSGGEDPHQDVAETLKASSTHMCTSRFISPDLVQLLPASARRSGEEEVLIQSDWPL